MAHTEKIQRWMWTGDSDQNALQCKWLFCIDEKLNTKVVSDK